MCVPKDLDNRWTYMVLLYNVASYGFWEGLWLGILGEGRLLIKTKTKESFILVKDASTRMDYT